jgi:hypothetical protein
MRWMKLTVATTDKPVYCNMARANFIHTHGEHTVIDFGDEAVSVTETPEEIIAAGKWEVR